MAASLPRGRLYGALLDLPAIKRVQLLLQAVSDYTLEVPDLEEGRGMLEAAWHWLKGQL
jgi:hypothetical protein